MTLSVPSGNGPPVKIRKVSPAPSARVATCPAATLPETASRTGAFAVARVVSALRSA